MKKKIEVVQDPENEIAPKVFEQAIVDISTSMKKLQSTRLSKKAIVTLVNADCKLGLGLCETVLDSLTHLEERWLKPKVKKS